MNSRQNSKRSRVSLSKRNRGVTLIELLVVLAILGIALTLAGPSMFKSMDRFALDSAGRQLVNTFRLARNEAKLGQQEILGTLSGRELVLLRGEQRIKGLTLPNNLELTGQDIAYTFLPSGQILGPERLELISGGRYHGVLILGPPPGTVRFERER
jgi:prepilin-type N-terminal cleavage/methylation domain-containing protein